MITGTPDVGKLQREFSELKARLAPLIHANRGGAYLDSNNLRGSQVTHSQLLGSSHPALGDFGGVSTYELQSPYKSQLGLSIAPTGNPLDGCTIFGLLNSVSAGLYTCGLVSSGFFGIDAPSMIVVVQGVNPNALIALLNTATTKYPIMMGAGTQSDSSGTGVLQINGDTQRLWGVRRTPANSAAAGFLGETCFDDNFVYIYTSVGWKRTALAAF